MISLTAEYALRAVVWIAGRPDGAVGTRDVAEATRVPMGYMSKVLQSLARAGLVRSRPGRSGGFVLARRPEAISVLDIVRAVDPIQRIDRCPLGRRRHNGNLCPLHRRLDEAIARVERAFAQSTVAELVSEAVDHDALCAGADAAQAAGGARGPRQRRSSRRSQPARRKASAVRVTARSRVG